MGHWSVLWSVPKWQRSKNGYLQSVGKLGLGAYSQAVYRKFENYFVFCFILKNHINFFFNLKIDLLKRCVRLTACQHVPICISVYFSLYSIALDDGGFLFHFFFLRMNCEKRTPRTYFWILDSPWISRWWSPESFDVEIFQRRNIF